MWTALDIFIGLALCYALISLFCTAIQEFIAQALDSRGKLLVQALHTINFAKLVEKLGTNFLANPGNLGTGESGTPQILTRTSQDVTGSAESKTQQLATAVGDSSPKVSEKKTIFVQSRRLMSDPTPENLAKTISSGMSLIVEGESKIETDDAIRKLLLPDGLTARLLALSKEARGDVDKVKAEVEKWCGDFLAEVNHWFTRRAQIVSLLIGFAVALALNVDTIELATKLSNDPVLREAAVKAAGQLVADGKLKDCAKPTTTTIALASSTPSGSEKPAIVTNPPGPSTPPNAGEPTAAPKPLAVPPATNAGKADDVPAALAGVKNCLKSVQINYPFPLGWGSDERNNINYVSKLLGLLLTAIALSLGSRFWFDALKSLLALRTGGQPKVEAK